MGAFFTNLQARGGDRPTRTREQIIDALRDRLREEGFVAVGVSDEADRSILVGPAGPWIAVYDEATEGQDEDVLHRLAALLSTAARHTVISILVHDSDVLRLGLFEAGRQLAEYDSNPSFSGRRKAKKLDIAHWVGLLGEGRQATELQAVLTGEKLFAEDTLRQVAELIGLDASRASVGYDYADKSDSALTNLRFRATVRPAHERLAEGTPRFEMAGHSPRLEGSVGSPLKAGFGVRNVGGASKGLEVVAWGEALAKNIVELTEAQLIVGSPESRQSPPAVRFERRAAKGGEPLWVAAFPDVEIPAGVAGGPDAFRTLKPKAAFEAMYRSGVHVNISGNVLTAGETTLRVGFVPQAAPDSGQYGYSCRLHAHPASRRPLRAPADVEAHALRTLEQRSTLFGLASCNAEITQAADVAAPLIERWGTYLSETGSYSLCIYSADAAARPKSGTAKAKGFFRSARWKKLREELPTRALVTGERQDSNAFDAVGFSVRRTDGFAFGRSLLPQSSADKTDTELPTLALWINLHERPEALIKTAAQLLAELLDEFMAKADGVQGLIGEWDWQPSTLDSSPYERACGVHGQCTLTRSWLTRFLRGVTDDWMWLGEDLLSRVNSERLDQVATTERVATGIRLRLRPGTTLDALEQVLAELLPDREDWYAGMARHSGRERLLPKKRET